MKHFSKDRLKVVLSVGLLHKSEKQANRWQTKLLRLVCHGNLPNIQPFITWSGKQKEDGEGGGSLGLHDNPNH